MGLISRLIAEPASSVAANGRLFSMALIGLASFFVLAVYASIIFFSWKYRKGSTAPRDNPPLYAWKLEVLWIGIPLILAIATFSWAASLYMQLFNIPPDAYRVYILGKQWMWKAYHSNGRAEINEIHLAKDRPVAFILGSQDVIHSLFIPDFKVKMDVVPGKFTQISFTPVKIGRFYLLCTQYCGTNHSLMRGSITVMEPSDFDQWLNQDVQQVSEVVAGEGIFKRLGCESCHGPYKQDLAPPLEGVFGRNEQLQDGRVMKVDENYLRGAILNPGQYQIKGYQNNMPAYSGKIPEEDLIRMILYIRSLSGGHNG